MSESISWEVCPSCGRTAAVGWRNERVVEVDCSSECRLDDDELRGIEGGRKLVKD